MHERGTYGRQARQALTNGYGYGYGAYGQPPWSAPPPMMGNEVSPPFLAPFDPGAEAASAEMRRAQKSRELKAAAVDIGANFIAASAAVLLGAWIGGKAAPEDRDKGHIIGGAVGYFGYLFGRQAVALESIATRAQLIADNTRR